MLLSVTGITADSLAGWVANKMRGRQHEEGAQMQSQAVLYSGTHLGRERRRGAEATAPL